ncbi:MAG: RNA polymerase sigma factor [Gammaproteobacteria bacterium]|nr:RNA polymerase sigma factor [Gammaproteobacteria bacterium]
MDQFLAEIQGRAFRMAQIATGSSDDALDLVQDAMFKLVEKYSDRPEQQWRPLFYRILQSRINDWYRRNQVRNRHRIFLNSHNEDGEDPIQTAKDESHHTPEAEFQAEQGMQELQLALEKLPLRQQQAFLLRAWEGLNVKQTAQAMSCAEGSVKTHYSRAIHSLREQLSEHWP